MSSHPESESRVLHWLNRTALRLGTARAVLAVTAAGTVVAILAAQGVVAAWGSGDRLLATAVAALGALVVTPALGWLVMRLVLELDHARQQLSVASTQDNLTGVHNRRHFMDLVQSEWDRARRYSTPAALLLIDADHFKRINDVQGQACGDELLRRITQVVREQLRQPDVLARFGGEELIVFLPHTDPLGALDVAERIRERVQSLNLPWRSATVNTTVSIGVAPLRNELPSLDWMIHEADTALQSAKADGRNCVRALPFEPSRDGGAYPLNLR